MKKVIKIISKTLMTKISHISWGVMTKAFTVYMKLIYANKATEFLWWQFLFDKLKSDYFSPIRNLCYKIDYQCYK